MSAGFYLGFHVLPILIDVFGFVIAALVIVFLVKAIRQWHYNNNAPMETVQATLIRKTCDVHHTHTPLAGDPTGAHGYSVSSRETLYGTFLTENGQEMRFTLSGSVYRELYEGQTGILSFQGTRYIHFQ